MSDREVERLYAAWKIALGKYHTAGTIKAMNDEQIAHDALVDYVETHELIDSEYDPRT